MSASRAGTDACRICSNHPLQPHMVVAGQTLLRCARCAFVQVETEPSAAELDAIYSDGYFTSAKYRGDRIAQDRENARRLGLLKRWARPGSAVLDAGCSTGDFLAHAKHAFQMHGLDYSAFAIETARQNNPELASRLRSGPIEATDWADAAFDAICLWDVIEHLWDPVTVMKDLFARLQPGGVIIVSTPAIDALTARISGRYWPFMTPPEHLSFFALKTFRQLAVQLGNCEIVHASRRGKWANVAFIAYKVTRIAPAWFPKVLLWPLFQWPLKRLSLYVPTGDILYLVLRKKP